jgi:hypothetical protein
MTRTIFKYRIFCNTENAYKFVWGDTTPTTCPFSSSHNIDASTISVVDSVKENGVVAENLPLSPLNDMRTTQRTILMDLKCTYGKNYLRDSFIEQGSANITCDTKYKLIIQSETDVSCLQSAMRGQYIPYTQGDVCITCSLASTLTGNQTLKIGYFDNTNGYFFKLSSANMYAVVLQDGVETLLVPQTSWNGNSTINLDPLQNNVYNLRFTKSQVEYRLGNGNDESTLCHTQSSIFLQNQNLPLTVRLESNGTAGMQLVNVYERQFSILGSYTPTFRSHAAYRVNVNVNMNAFINLLSIKRKSGFEGNMIKVIEADVTSSNGPVLVQLLTETTLTGANFLDAAASVSAVEYDVSASNVTGGIPVWTSMVSSGTNTIKVSSKVELNELETLTVFVQPLASSSTVSIVLRWTEDW